MLTLSACGPSSDNAPQPTVRNLPEWPAQIGTPVGVRGPTAGEDARGYAARERAGRVEANRRIEGLRKWYGGVRADYSGGQADGK